jgi:hypothetical protein
MSAADERHPQRHAPHFWLTYGYSLLEETWEARQFRSPEPVEELLEVIACGLFAIAEALEPPAPGDGS